ncbi:hypothetical protein T10_4438 [Trichinella papuae]|uniref:Uncharacterized protein n=1 Tax=Trichinella papuae TaxID=268474 RepID=A0A0V1MS76_9BILA|nr:hypothetical protein T10_4438 [Trichinella papuae]
MQRGHNAQASRRALVRIRQAISPWLVVDCLFAISLSVKCNSCVMVTLHDVTLIKLMMFLKNNGDGDREGELVQFKTDNPWQSTSLKGTLDTNVSIDELDAITSDIQRQHLPMLEQFLFSTLLNSLFIKIHLIRPCKKPSSITNLLTGLTEGQILGATAPSVKQ